MSEERGRAARLFEGIANALLERAVPRVREWLQGRFGAGADVSGIRLEGREVHVDDTRVPLGERARLSIARATFRVTGEAARPVVLQTLTGELRIDEGGLIAPVRFEAAASVRAEAWIDGALRVERATWPRVDGTGEPASLDGSLDVIVTSTQFTLTRGELTSAEARIKVDAEGDLDETGSKRLGRARVELAGARLGHFTDAAHAITGVRIGGALTLLRDAVLEGVLHWTESAGLDADLHAHTARSKLRVRATAALDETIGGSIEGDASVGELLTAFGGNPLGHHETARCEARLAGTTHAPRTFGTLSLDGATQFDLAPTDDGLSVRFADAPAKLAEIAWAFTGGAAPALPRDARFSGEIALGKTIEGELGVETATSALVAKAKLDRNGTILDALVRGRLSFADARELFPESVRPRAEGAMQVVARVEGTTIAPIAHVEVDAPAVELEVPALEPLPLRAVNARLSLERTRVVVRALRAKLHGGDASAEGIVSWAAAFRGTQWRLRLAGVRIEDVALDRERTLGTWIAGAMTASITMEKRGDGPLAGGGELRVDAPLYRALAQLTPTLGRHGVSTPSPEGVAPLVARFGFGERGVRFEGIELRVDGAAARGIITIDWTKLLSGRLDVDLAERHVRNSALLGIPAMLTSTIRLVVNLSGTINEPNARVDPLETLGVADAVATVRSAFEGLFPVASPRSEEDPELDAVLDRILDHDPRSEQLIASLVDRGIDPDEFERLLERRRRRRRR